MVTECDKSHPVESIVSLSVYSVVADGLAIGLAIAEELKPVAGVHK